MKEKLRILVVHSGTKEIIPTFIIEQVNSLINQGVKIEYFTIKKGGLVGYLSHIKEFKSAIKNFTPDIVHAHYGLSGLFANLQRKIPVVTTFHGSDVFNPKNKVFSLLAHWLSKESVFVSSLLKQKLGVKNGKIITCGIDLEVFKSNGAKRENFVLFSGSFSKKVKNYPLAKKSIDLYNMNNKDINELRLIELVNKTRVEVADLMNRAKALLISSHYEGSSQVLKEAMACNCPVVSVNVGSVSDLVKPNSSSVIIVQPNEESIAGALEGIKKISSTQGRKEIIDQKISLEETALQLIELYNSIKKS